MGQYDIVLVQCPRCGNKTEFHSKTGDCSIRTFDLEEDEIPPDVLMGVNREAPYECSFCKKRLAVNLELVFQPTVMALRLVKAMPVIIPHSESLELPATTADALELNDWPRSFDPRKPLICDRCTHWRRADTESEMGVCMFLSAKLSSGDAVSTRKNFGCTEFFPDNPTITTLPATNETARPA